MTPHLSSPHILCVNPWIHDFAAFDFWAKPLGLLLLASILRKGGAQVTFMDCLDRFHPRSSAGAKIHKDGRGHFRKEEIPFPGELHGVKKRFSRYGIAKEWFYQDLRHINKPDLILVTSLMTYWASGVRETISVIKDVYPDVPVVLGGIYVSLCTAHAEKNSMADHVSPGSGESVIKSLVKYYTGFSLSFSCKANDLDALPWPALDMVSRLSYAPVLTSRGCPFSCAYCASSFLNPVFCQRSFESVFQEIQHWYEAYNVINFAFYDDALLINQERFFLPLLEKIIQSGMTAAFHTPNALHIREIKQKTAELMFQSGFKTIRLGLETADFSEARHYDAKVKENEFFNAVNHLKHAGFDKHNIGAYLLCGLPGQDLSEVESSIQIVKKYKITPVLAYYTPIPHTPMWEQAVENAVFDIEKDPIFTNNALFPCLDRTTGMKSIYRLKQLAQKDKKNLNFLERICE